MSTFAASGGTVIRSAGKFPLRDVGGVLARMSDVETAAAARMLVVASTVESPTAAAVENLVTMLEKDGGGVGRIVCFGAASNALQSAAAKRGCTVERAGDRFVLRDMIAAHWRDHDRPLLGVSYGGGFGISWALDDVFASTWVLGAGGTPRRSMRVTTRDAQFDLISGVGACLRKANEPPSRLVTPGTVAGMGLVSVAPGALRGSGVTSASFAAPLRTIGHEAFADCTALEKVLLPGSVELIGDSAFEGCISLEQVILRNGLRTLGAGAFRGCSALHNVTVPATVTTIGEGAFDETAAPIRFTVSHGSFGHRWVSEHGFDYDVLPDEGATHIDSPRTRVIEHQGIEYEVLPGDMLEVRKVGEAASRSTVALPTTVAGLTVRGLGTDAIGRDCRVRALQLPSSVRWLAPWAISPTASLASVVGGGGIQARGRKSVPERVPPLGPLAPLDASSTRLSLRMVCDILDVELPRDLDGAAADAAFTRLSAGELTTVPGSLYLGRFRANDTAKIDRLVQRGVQVFLTNRELTDGEGKALRCVVHPEPVRAFEKLCGWIADQYPEAMTIAITGSVGKTSTKEMVQQVCSTSKVTLFSEGNQNGVAQVGRHIQRLNGSTEVFIQETGAARPGLVESGARMLHPHAFIITNIGVNHIGNYGGSQENILADKISHDRYLPDDGVAFVNFDDPRLRTLSLRHRIISYAIDNREAEYYADNIVERDGRLTFVIVEARTGIRVDATVDAFGRHNVGNAVVAFALGRWLDLPPDNIVEGIGSFRSEGLRQNLTEIGGRRVLVDCYNASELAMVSTVDALQQITVPEGGRRVMVFADIDDKLGDVTEEVHRRVGRRMVDARDIDAFVCFGAHASWTAEELRIGGREVFATTDRDELHHHLHSELRAADVAAFKGGQQMALSITIDRLFGSSFVLLDGDVLHKRGTALSADGVRFRMIHEYGVEVRGLEEGVESDEVIIPSTIEHEPVRLIGRRAFARSRVKSIVLPASVRTIGPSAFFQSNNLAQLALPESLRVIGARAFNGCSSLRTVEIPDGVTTIGRGAFARCENLENVYIPDSVLTIEESIFSYSRGVTIECTAGSYAEKFCRQHWPGRTLRIS